MDDNSRETLTGTVQEVVSKVDPFWTKGKVLAALATVVISAGAGLVAQGRWTERMTQAVETIAEDHGFIEQRLDRLAGIVEGHMLQPSHTHQSALNHELRALAQGANDKVEAYMTSDKQVEKRWFRVEWPEHMAEHKDIENRLRVLEARPQR